MVSRRNLTKSLPKLVDDISHFVILVMFDCQVMTDIVLFDPNYIRDYFQVENILSVVDDVSRAWYVACSLT